MATPRPLSVSSGWFPGTGAALPERFLDGTVTIRAARPRGKKGKRPGEVNGHAAIDLEGRHELRDGRHPGALVPGDGELEQGLVQPALSRTPGALRSRSSPCAIASASSPCVRRTARS